METDLITPLGLDREQVEAVTTIASASPESAGLLAGLMLKNEKDLAWVDGIVLEAITREKDKWKERALEAEERIDRIYRKLDWLMK